MVVTELAIALLAAAAIFLDAPFLLDWHNAAAVFNDPVKAHIGLVLLTHQLGYFNILPLYVVFIVQVWISSAGQCRISPFISRPSHGPSMIGEAGSLRSYGDGPDWQVVFLTF